MKNIFVLAALGLLLASCGGSDKRSMENYTSTIDSLEQKRNEYLAQGNFPPKVFSKQLIQEYEFCVADYPDSDKAANYLFMAAQRYDSDLQDYKNAAIRYQEVYDKYTDYDNRPMALFHVGNAYHSLNDSTLAIKAFKEFKQTYPNHDFADDAEGMINLIRMGGEEEFMRRIQEAAQQEIDA